MRRGPALPAFFGLLLMAAAASAQTQGVTIYIQRILVSDPGDVRLGDLVRTSGAIPDPARETLALSVATISDHLLYIPGRLCIDRIGDAFGRDSIVVGSRTLVIPRGAVPDATVPLMDKLVDFLGDAGVLGAEPADIEIKSIHVTGTLPQNIVPVFQIARSSRGSVEITFAAAEAGQGSGKILLALKEERRTAAADIKASDPVRVIFHKGPITIETQGKAQASAAVGETVNVLAGDSARTFSGRLRDGKVVDVELP